MPPSSATNERYCPCFYMPIPYINGPSRIIKIETFLSATISLNYIGQWISYLLWLVVWNWLVIHPSHGPTFFFFFFFIQNGSWFQSFVFTLLYFHINWMKWFCRICLKDFFLLETISVMARYGKGHALNVPRGERTPDSVYVLFFFITFEAWIFVESSVVESYHIIHGTW